jgi:hypothetical protein
MEHSIEKTEMLLKLWGLHQPKSGVEHLGYGQSKLGGLSGGGSDSLPSYAQDALVDVSAAIKALRQVEPEAAKVLMARYLFEEDMATIGRNLRDPVTGTPKTRAAVSKLSVSGVSWISGYLEKL